MANYVAHYRYDGRAWAVRFRDPDIATFGRTLRVAKQYARELLAVHLELPSVDALMEAGAEIDDVIQLPDGVDAEIDLLAKRRREAEAIRTEVASETRRAAAALRHAGLSTRDVGELLGISSARVAQMER